MKKFYTRTQAARYLGVSAVTIDRAKASGRLRFSIEGRTPLFEQKALLAWKEVYDRAQAGIATMRDGKELFNGSAAARYLCMTRQGFSWHKQSGHIVPDAKRGKLDMYSRENLDEFARKRRKMTRHEL